MNALRPLSRTVRLGMLLVCSLTMLGIGLGLALPALSQVNAPQAGQRGS